LFNSIEKKVSAPCPAFVGRIAEKAANGESLDVAAGFECPDGETKARTVSFIRNIAGNAKFQKFPVGVYDRTFYKTLVLSPSPVCSLNCVYCSGKAGEKKLNKMDWHLAKAAIDYFFCHCDGSGPYTLQFHGAGEPMTNAGLVKKAVEYARMEASKKHAALYTRISTNGVFPAETALWLANNMDHVSLSLDGPPDIHNRQRPKRNGSGSYDNVVKTMKILEKTGVLKRVNTVITNDGIDRMEEILRHIHALGSVKQIRILPMEYCGRGANGLLDPVDTEKFTEWFNEILPTAKSLGLEIVSVVEQMDYCTDYYCGACGFTMCITPGGLVSTCVEAMDEQEYGVGELFIGRYNAGSRSIDIDWDKVARLRTRTYHNLEACVHCAFRTNCSGNCLIRAGRKNGTVMSVDKDACNMVKTVLEKKFREMAEDLYAVYPVTMPAERGRNSFADVINLSREVAKRFDEIERRPWTIETTIIEMMKQVGDLSRQFMAYEKYYLPDRADHPRYRTSVDAIANELADILHNVIRIADYYGIDLESAHLKARADEAALIESLKSGRQTY
jgi:uncharacterized protein